MTALLPAPAEDFMTLAQASRAIRSRALSPVELVDRCLAQVADRDPHVHAFVTLHAAQVREQAREAEAALDAGNWRGPLHGIPLGIKDVIDVAGLPTKAQSRSLAHNVASSDAWAVVQWREAGGIVMGKLTTHEFAFGSPTIEDPSDPDAPGTAARNPWDTDHFAGGSSSGAAVGVACGMILGALGSDTAGSIRSPAALCGMTGFKPSRTRIRQSGSVPLAPSLDTIGMIARTAEDCAMLYDVFDRDAVDVKNSFAAMQASEQVLAEIKMGFVRHFLSDGVPVSRSCENAIAQAACAFEQGGATVEEVRLPSLDYWQAAGMTMLLYEAFAAHADGLRAHPAQYGKSFRDAVAVGGLFSGEDYEHAVRLRDRLSFEIEEAMAHCDVLIAPIQPGEAPLLKDLDQWGFLRRPSYGLPFNVADLPAISVCCGFGDQGLPLALQLVGKRGAERQLLAVAHAYQQITNSHQNWLQHWQAQWQKRARVVSISDARAR